MAWAFDYVPKEEEFIPPKRWSMNAALSLTSNDIRRMSVVNRAKFINYIASKISQQRRFLEKQGLVSPAIRAYENMFDGTKIIGSPYSKPYQGGNISPKYTKQRLYTIAVRALATIQDETFMEIGAKEAQDDAKRAFMAATTEKGVPILSDKDTDIFWKVIDEFRQNPIAGVDNFYIFKDMGLINIWLNPKTRPTSLTEAMASVWEEIMKRKDAMDLKWWDKKQARRRDWKTWQFGRRGDYKSASEKFIDSPEGLKGATLPEILRMARKRRGGDS